MSNFKKNSILVALMLSVALPAHASITPAVLNEKNQLQVESAQAEMKAFQKTQQEACADPNEDGSMAQKQAAEMEDQKKIATTSIDLGSVYDIGKKGGCFAALSDFPDLSVNIPTLSGMLDSLKKTLIKYAVRRACTAINDAFSEMLSPLTEAINKVSDRGQIDLTGMVNKEVTKSLYEIDPELGRVNSANTEKTDYEFTW